MIQTMLFGYVCFRILEGAAVRLYKFFMNE